MATGYKIINGDYVISNSGSVETIEGGEKCLRDFEKMMRTNVESSDAKPFLYRYNPEYGNLLKRLISSNMSRNAIIDVSKSLLYNTIKRYLSLQESRNNLSSGEIIIDIQYNIFYDPNRPAVLKVPIKIKNADGVTYDINTLELRV